MCDLIKGSVSLRVNCEISKPTLGPVSLSGPTDQDVAPSYKSSECIVQMENFKLDT